MSGPTANDAFRLLQLIALTLPAVTILMQVLAEIEKEIQEIGSPDTVATELVTQVKENVAFSFLRWGMFMLLGGGILLLGFLLSIYIGNKIGILYGFGTGIVILSYVFFGIAGLKMETAQLTN